MSTTKATVVLFVDTRNFVCLARKKQAIHHEGEAISYSLGLWNGYGGKMEVSDESIESTAIRELFDESGVLGKKEDLVAKGSVLFLLSKESKEEPFMEVTFYFLHKWVGSPKETFEMGEPTFFQEDALPYQGMMPADKVIFETMFQGKKLEGEVVLFGKETAPTFRLV